MSCVLGVPDCRQYILEQLTVQGSVSVSGLFREPGVTPVTARADRAALEQAGMRVRTQGDIKAGINQMRSETSV